MKTLRFVLFISICWLINTALVSEARAQDLVENVTNELGSAEWIWSPAHTRNEIPVGECFFRKTFELTEPDVGEVQIAADNEFVLFVNGKQVGKGNDWRQLQVFEISPHLVRGRNSVSIHVKNTDEGSAGLVGRVLVREKSGTYVSHPTNKSWKTSVKEYSEWTAAQFADKEWINATSYGVLGLALPWGNEVVIAGVGARFNIAKDFAIERLMRDDEVGSLIAMAFDAQGNILASREGGNLMLITDSDDNGTPDSVSIFCDKLINVQGILPLGTRVFAIGDGPEGEALYRLRDADRDGVAEEVQSLVPIRGSKGEHGAHAVRLGPDGLLYVIIGDHARVGKQAGPLSPYRNAYEGDIIHPRFDDPRGHAVGIPAPGGTIFRTDVEGKLVELVAGGMRNSYDFAFSPAGEIFTYDSDMEWDMGAPWYRPTRVSHTTEGAELGWRSGWAKWPEYYLDSVPATISMGAGSPTGVEFYDHNVFPEQYRGAMFGCDWATGRIHAIKFQRKGATYQAKSEVFVAGRPLNATDVVVGPDGALYFCTGGRGTDGGIYRVRWAGATPLTPQESGIDVALHQPQLDTDWARTKIVGVKNSLGDQWDAELNRVALDASRTNGDRCRALDLMAFFGPRPSDELLLQLTSDTQAEVRAKAARLMFTSSSPACSEKLCSLLGDKDALVRRVACETLVRQGTPAPVPALLELLSDSDRFVAFAARRTLERQPAQSWAAQVLEHGDVKVFCRGSVAALAATRDTALAQAVMKRCETLVQAANLSAEQFVDVLRVSQLAIELGKLPPEQSPSLGNALLARYPSGSAAADCELVRLLVYLQVPGAADKFAAQISGELPYEDKLHIAAYASRLDAGWNIQAKLAVMTFLEESRTVKSGYSVTAYVENFARDFFTRFTLPERQQVLAAGERWPASALSVLAKLPPQPPVELLAVLRELDGRVQPLCAKGDEFRRLRVGIFAILGRSGEPQSAAYLRTIYSTEPADRPTVAMSLTQNPDGDNWPYLVDSLKTVDGRVAQEVLSSLTKVSQRPQEPEAFRQVILQGLRLREEGSSLALKLLDHWAGRQPAEKYDDWQQQLAGWQQWYAKNFPGASPAELPQEVAGDKWSYEELLAYLESEGARGADPQQGRIAFEQAQCVKCHRCGGLGETLGPDLTAVTRRFQKREILEAVVYPSHIISDQYSSRIVVSNGKTFSGLVVPRGDQGVTVLLADGEKVDLAQSEIEEVKVSNVSAMPTGLLNQLSLEHVGHLFAFLEAGSQPPQLAREPGSQQR
jgi:putative membrane-bound dehydrogenase-like protein